MLLDTISNDIIPEEVIEFTTQKLLSLLADLGNSTITQLETTSSTTNNNHTIISNTINNNTSASTSNKSVTVIEVHKLDVTKYLSPTLLYMAWYHVWTSHQCKLKLRRDVEVEDTDVPLQDTMFAVMDHISHTNYSESVISALQISLKDAIQCFVLQVYFYVITTDDIEIELFLSLMNIIPTLLTLGIEVVTAVVNTATKKKLFNNTVVVLYKMYMIYLSIH